MKTMIITFLDRDHREWDRYLRDFCFVVYNSASSSTNASSAFLNLDRELMPVYSLRHRLVDIAEIEVQPTENWSQRMRQLASLRKWVTENLEKAY